MAEKGVLKVLAVCGVGMGSSLMMKMTIESALKKLGVKAEVTHTDFASMRGSCAAAAACATAFANCVLACSRALACRIAPACTSRRATSAASASRSALNARCCRSRSASAISTAIRRLCLSSGRNAPLFGGGCAPAA